MKGRVGKIPGDRFSMGGAWVKSGARRLQGTGERWAGKRKQSIWKDAGGTPGEYRV